MWQAWCVTQCGSGWCPRPIFIATLRAGASWPFFRVARSTRMTKIWALRSRLEKQPTDRRRRHHYLRDGALAGLSQLEGVAAREAALDGHRDQKVCTTKAIFSLWSRSL